MMTFCTYFSQGESPPLTAHELRSRQRAPITPQQRPNSRTRKTVPNTVRNYYKYGFRSIIF